MRFSASPERRPSRSRRSSTYSVDDARISSAIHTAAGRQRTSARTRPSRAPRALQPARNRAFGGRRRLRRVHAHWPSRPRGPCPRDRASPEPTLGLPRVARFDPARLLGHRLQRGRSRPRRTNRAALTYDSERGLRAPVRSLDRMARRDIARRECARARRGPLGVHVCARVAKAAASRRARRERQLAHAR